NGEPAIRVWGSPDIPADMNVSIQLPRRKPIPMVMHHVGPAGPAAPADPPAQAAPPAAATAPVDDLPL
ncbi:MAG TPA: hypothetical protein VN829_04420, partial [Dongiaceae bacterium]|nr:hypothetical protein [Dongiaceae bacterium]